MKKQASSKNPKVEASEIGNVVEMLRNHAARASRQETVFEFIDILSARATDGDIDSFNLLINISIKVSMNVEDLTKSCFDLARKVARRTPFWPVLLAPSANMFRSNESLAKRLELGAEFTTPIDLERTFREATIPRKIAVWLLFLTHSLRRFNELVLSEIAAEQIIEYSGMHVTDSARELAALSQSDIQRCKRQKTREVESADSRLHQLANEIRVSCDLEKILVDFTEDAYRLPPLSPTTVKNWATFGKDVLMVLTDQHPERNPVLYEIGKYRQNAHYRKDTTTATFSERKKTAKASEESNVRDGIFTRIKAAYVAVTAGDHNMNEGAGSKTSPQSADKDKGET